MRFIAMSVYQHVTSANVTTSDHHWIGRADLWQPDSENKQTNKKENEEDFDFVELKQQPQPLHQVLVSIFYYSF